MPPLYQRYGLRKGDDDQQHWYVVAVPIALRQALRGLLLSALAWSDGSQSRAAGALHISERAMASMMSRHGIPMHHAAFTKRKKRDTTKIGVAARARRAREAKKKGHP